MIIGVNGKIGSGKDTVGRIIQYLTSECGDSNSSRHRTYAEFLERGGGSNLRNFDQHYVSDWKIKKYAGKLKQTASLLTGIPVEMFEDQEFKKTALGPQWNYNDIIGYGHHNVPVYGESEQEMLVREFLQKLGTEGMRVGVHTNVWVNALFSDYVPISDISKSNTYIDDRLHHGYKGTRIWSTYHNIKQRCNNVKHPRYNDYGGRGITMCEEWLNDITSFINWAIENGYNKDLTIDRIDNDKGYSPDNCRCVSYAVQATNTSLRKDNTTGYKGVSIDKKNGNRIRANIQIKGKAKFLGYYDTFEEASEVYELAFLERERLYLHEEKSNLVYPSWCITDMRFPNEMEAIVERKGITIRVTRPVKKNKNTPRLHPSETSLDKAKFDYEIINDGTIEDLVEKVREILTKENII
jgi:hypothetical protein